MKLNIAIKKKYSEQSFGVRFAAKEAVAKALGTGFSSKLGWKDFYITNLKTGQPSVEFNKKVYENFGKVNILLSISHTKNFAFAVAIALRDPT